MLMILRKQPGETREEFIRRVVDTAPPLSDSAMAVIRRLLPPVRADRDQDRPVRRGKP
ncbi:hypothetical protein [Amycolatopsis sp. NPDC051128]|uniref:hypothetical protein n=1 Tax=Amycolatopsis sp. NPDC051128 TaxID=3155412 RepID=UPI00344A7BFD